MSNITQHFGWVEIVFTAAVALGFGLYQLWSINRELRRDRAAEGENERKDRAD